MENTAENEVDYIEIDGVQIHPSHEMEDIGYVRALCQNCMSCVCHSRDVLSEVCLTPALPGL